jgi:hypothetical protein
LTHTVGKAANQDTDIDNKTITDENYQLLEKLLLKISAAKKILEGKVTRFSALGFFL